MRETIVRFQVMLMNYDSYGKHEWIVPESADGTISKFYETAEEAKKEMYDFWLTESSGLKRTSLPLKFAVMEVETINRILYGTVDHLILDC